MDVDDARRLKSLETENGKLKRLLADRLLEIEVLKEINAKKMVSARGRPQQVGYARSRGLSARRACALVATARSGLKFESKRDVAALRAAAARIERDVQSRRA